MYSGNASNLLMDWIHLFGTNVLRSFDSCGFSSKSGLPTSPTNTNHQNNMTGFRWQAYLLTEN
jgi:hypothetical protein